MLQICSNEPPLIKEIVTIIFNNLLSTSVRDTENLVGIDALIKKNRSAIMFGVRWSFRGS